MEDVPSLSKLGSPMPPSVLNDLPFVGSINDDKVVGGVRACYARTSRISSRSSTWVRPVKATTFQRLASPSRMNSS